MAYKRDLNTPLAPTFGDEPKNISKKDFKQNKKYSDKVNRKILYTEKGPSKKQMMKMGKSNSETGLSQGFHPIPKPTVVQKAKMAATGKKK